MLRGQKHRKSTELNAPGRLVKFGGNSSRVDLGLGDLKILFPRILSIQIFCPSEKKEQFFKELWGRPGAKACAKWIQVGIKNKMLKKDTTENSVEKKLGIRFPHPEMRCKFFRGFDSFCIPGCPHGSLIFQSFFFGIHAGCTFFARA